MRVLGVDSAMRASGWQLLELDPNDIRPQASYHPTHTLMTRVAGGTITATDTEETRLQRMLANAEQVHSLVSQYKPDLLVIEGALDKGQNRSTTGMALYALIMAPWHPTNYQDGKPKLVFNLQPEAAYIPPYLVTITPERLMSMAHGTRSLKGGEIVRKYRTQAKNPPKGRVSQHEVDGYLLAYHGTRFYYTCLTDKWPKSILTRKEIAIFYDSTVVDEQGRKLAGTPMKQQEGSAWWSVNSSRPQEANSSKEYHYAN